jgi:NAD(P)-dependent dehydrogenase (short-subunit alcohol dehydrogenase family)
MEITESSFKLQDRTALITGPCTSFNQAIAMKLTQMGTNIALVDRNVEKIQRFAEQIMDAREVHERFGRAVALQADLTKPHHAQDAIGRAAEAFGGIDIYIDGLMTAPVKRFRDASTLEELERVIEINLRVPLLLTHLVLRYLEGKKRGRVIYLMHDLPRTGFQHNGLMAASRSGLSTFVRTLSREAAEYNITANCVSLGLTEELLLSQNGESSSVQSAHAKLLESLPGAPLTEPERIANLVAFLASPLGAGITGQTIAVSQGLSLLS